MENKLYSVIVNAVIYNNGKILISQRSQDEKHQPGSWTVPGGKIENPVGTENELNIVENTLVKEIREEVGIEITGNFRMIANNTFHRSHGDLVLAIVFLCEYSSGIAKPLEDTINVKWISPTELNNFEFPPNVKDYIAKGFALLPYLPKKKTKNIL